MPSSRLEVEVDGVELGKKELQFIFEKKILHPGNFLLPFPQRFESIYESQTLFLNQNQRPYIPMGGTIKFSVKNNLYSMTNMYNEKKQYERNMKKKESQTLTTIKKRKAQSSVNTFENGSRKTTLFLFLGK